MQTLSIKNKEAFSNLTNTVLEGHNMKEIENKYPNDYMRWIHLKQQRIKNVKVMAEINLIEAKFFKFSKPIELAIGEQKEIDPPNVALLH